MSNDTRPQEGEARGPSTEVLGQPVLAFPELLNGEAVVFETVQRIPVLVFVTGAVFIIIPPFVLAPLALVSIAYFWWLSKDGRIVLTNFRLLIFRKRALGGYVLDSIPLPRIKLVTTWTHTLNLLVEHKTIDVVIEGSLLPKAKCAFVKNAKQLIRKLEHQKSAVSNPGPAQAQ